MKSQYKIITTYWNPKTRTTSTETQDRGQKPDLIKTISQTISTAERIVCAVEIAEVSTRAGLTDVYLIGQLGYDSGYNGFNGSGGIAGLWTKEQQEAYDLGYTDGEQQADEDARDWEHERCISYPDPTGQDDDYQPEPDRMTWADVDPA